MTELPTDPDELLQALLCGDLDPNDAAVAERLSGEPALAERWQELSAIEQALHGTRPVREEALAAASAPDPGGADDAALLRQLRPPGGPAAPSTATPLRRGRGWRFGLAAAAMLMLGLATAWYAGAFAGSTPDEDSGYRWLGTGGIEILDGLPFGSLRLRLSDDDPLDTLVIVHAHALDATGGRVALLRSFPDVGSETLELTAAETDDHPGLEWEITVESDGSAVPRVRRFRQMR